MSYTEKDVAEWMVTQFKTGELYQEDVVFDMCKKFGRDYVYENENGNDAISKKVLKEFRKLTEGQVVWERSGRYWRVLTQKEQANYKSRLSE